jgi:glucosamine--fructose-6-phosphate aminotransferase (isomerizing)
VTKLSYLEQEMPRQAWAITETARVVDEQVSRWSPAGDDAALSRVVLTGCGDSLFAAGLCQMMASEGGVAKVCAIEALELSRYQFLTLDDRSVVVALSYSGETVRVLEAAIAGRARGSRVVALTRDADSALASRASEVVTYPDLGERSNTRTLSFQAAVVALARILQGLGVLSCELTDAKRWAQVAHWVDETQKASRGAVSSFAERCALPGMASPRLLGAGPSLVAAQYGAAKLYEAATIAAHDIELEEFCHRDIFTVGPSTPVVLIAPAGRSDDRASEVLGALNELGAPTLCVTNVAELAEGGLMSVELPAAMDEMCTPVVAAPVFQMLALDLARERGEDPDVVSNKKVNSPLIRECGHWGSDDYAALRVGSVGRS